MKEQAIRVFGALFATETNSFSPIPTGMRGFRDKLLITADGPGGWRERVPILDTWATMAAQDGYEFVFGIAAEAAPAGSIVASVYKMLRNNLLSALAGGGKFDLVLLALHGAMAAEDEEDCEGDLLRHIREIVGDDCVIGVELDPHCHLTAAMLESADLMIAYKEYPHSDEVARAREVYTLSRDTALGYIRPVTAVFECRMSGLWPTAQQPMRGFVDKLFEIEEAPGILSANLGQGFPWANAADIGAKVWIIANGDAGLAQRTAERLGREFYNLRDQFAPEFMTIDAAIDVALSQSGPVVLADVADNPGGGAPGDSTFILTHLIERGIGDVALGCLWDPVAAAMAADAGPGATLPLRVGGKVAPFSGLPVDIIATVRAVKEDHWQTSVGGEPAPLGLSVWITAAGIDIVLCSIRDQVFHPDAFEGLGLPALGRHIVVVKSTQHFRAHFAPRASVILYVATPGAIAPDIANIPYNSRQRPWWPLDADPLD